MAPRSLSLLKLFLWPLTENVEFVTDFSASASLFGISYFVIIGIRHRQNKRFCSFRFETCQGTKNKYLVLFTDR